MGKREIRPLATPKPLNRSSQEVAHVITSSMSTDTQNLVTIPEGVSFPRMREFAHQNVYSASICKWSPTGRAILNYDVVIPLGEYKEYLTQRIFNSRSISNKVRVSSFTYLLIYLLPVYLLPFKYLLIYSLIYLHLMAYGHTPFPMSWEFCPSVNAKTTWSISDCIIIHYAVPTSFKHHPILTG